jgi:hypothetical protein
MENQQFSLEILYSREELAKKKSIFLSNCYEKTVTVATRQQQIICRIKCYMLYIYTPPIL